jgi:hypothetical protein
MSITIDDYVAAAGECVPSHGNGWILRELPDELIGNFGDRFPAVDAVAEPLEQHQERAGRGADAASQERAVDTTDG